MYLTKSLCKLNTSEFENSFVSEIQQLSADLLPLQQGLSVGNYFLDNNLKVMFLGVKEEMDIVNVKAGVFYSSITAGCSCADDPTPIEEHNEYCELMFSINKHSGFTKVTLVSD